MSTEQLDHLPPMKNTATTRKTEMNIRETKPGSTHSHSNQNAYKDMHKTSDFDKIPDIMSRKQSVET
jgi:hypothetical protein